MSSKTVEEAFDEWRRKEWPRQKEREESLYDVVDLYDAFAAGAAHGAAEEREAVLADLRWISQHLALDTAPGACIEMERRIRQRGEK